MKNTSISLEPQLLEDGRRHAAKFGVSFNAWVGKLIKDALSREPEKHMEELMKLAKQSSGNSKGQRWKRDEIYQR
jgi:cytochrome P450